MLFIEYGPEWLSVGQAAELAGVSEWTVRRLLRAGLSGSRKVGRRWQLEASSWRRYIAEHTVEGATGCLQSR